MPRWAICRRRDGEERQRKSRYRQPSLTPVMVREPAARSPVHQFMLFILLDYRFSSLSNTLASFKSAVSWPSVNLAQSGTSSPHAVATSPRALRICAQVQSRAQLPCLGICLPRKHDSFVDVCLRRVIVTQCQAQSAAHPQRIAPPGEFLRICDQGFLDSCQRFSFRAGERLRLRKPVQKLCCRVAVPGLRQLAQPPSDLRDTFRRMAKARPGPPQRNPRERSNLWESVPLCQTERLSGGTLGLVGCPEIDLQPCCNVVRGGQLKGIVHPMRRGERI